MYLAGYPPDWYEVLHSVCTPDQTYLSLIRFFAAGWTDQQPRGNIFRVTGPLCGEFTGQRRIPRAEASDAEHWCFLWYVPEKTAEQTIEKLVIWDTVVLDMTLL